jgi:hypothetical protein
MQDAADDLVTEMITIKKKVVFTLQTKMPNDSTKKARSPQKNVFYRRQSVRSWKRK